MADHLSEPPRRAPLVSIAMPVFNAQRTLPITLRSIALQTYPHWELILIDDGSRDDTLAVARTAAMYDSRILVIEGGDNAGLAARLNQCVGLAKGPYLARMDADDIAYPSRLATQVKFLEENPQCDLVGCGVVIFADDGQLCGRFDIRLTHESICANPWVGIPLPHPSWLGRRAWFEQNRYRADYKKTQDQELLLRTYHQSQFACVPETLLGYRQDRRSLYKLLVGRRNFSRAIIREAWLQRALLSGILGLVVQIGKAAADLLTTPFGLDRWLRGESDSALTVLDQQHWRDVWDAVTGSQTNWN